VKQPAPVAYLVPRFPSLSETFVANEIDRLLRLGVAVHVLSFVRPTVEDQEKLGPVSRRLLGEVHYVGTATALWAALLQQRELLRGWRENARLHAQSTSKPNALLRLLRAAAIVRWMRRHGIRHLHAHWPYASQVAHLVHIMSGASYSVSVHAHEVAHDNGHFPLIFPALSFAAFCNRGAMDYLLARLAAPSRARAHLVYHGVDLHHFAPLTWPASNQPISIISAGRLTRTKGFDRLIRACGAARRQGLDIKLTLLGRGPMEPELRQLIVAERISDHVSLPGWVRHEEVNRHMGAAHLFALLADDSFHDGLPNVVLEAMACGRPVILSPMPAASEIVTHGSEGFVLRSTDDLAGFVDCIRRFAAEPGLLQSMGQAARLRVESGHDADAQITKVAELLSRHAA